MKTDGAYWELSIWDVGTWESGGERAPSWVIQIDGLPDDFRPDLPAFHHDPEAFAIYLTEEEVVALGLEEEVKEDYEALCNLFGKGSHEAGMAKTVTIQGVEEFLRDYNVPDRVRAILESLPKPPLPPPPPLTPW